MDLRLLRSESERIIGEVDAYPNEGRVNHLYQATKRAQTASAGQGRRPQPRFLSNRLRFCPAAIRKASQLTRQSSRSRKRRMPCQSLASANKGSTQTERLRVAFL